MLVLTLRAPPRISATRRPVPRSALAPQATALAASPRHLKAQPGVGGQNVVEQFQGARRRPHTAAEGENEREAAVSGRANSSLQTADGEP